MPQKGIIGHFSWGPTNDGVLLAISLTCGKRFPQVLESARMSHKLALKLLLNRSPMAGKARLSLLNSLKMLLKISEQLLSRAFCPKCVALSLA